MATVPKPRGVVRHMIAERAYYRAERRGFEPGHDLEDWLAAERETLGTEDDQHFAEPEKEHPDLSGRNAEPELLKERRSDDL